MQNIKLQIKNKKFSITLLTIILLLGLVLRLWHLGLVPPSPDWDEAALGYDAYSIMHTGRDEFGTFLPAVLRSFDDYKPALYAYLMIPSVAVFGLTTFAVRFPSVVMGVVGIVAIYFLVLELFGDRKIEQNSAQNYAEILALVAAFIFAISPWSLQFSRTAFETNTGLTFNLLAGLFFLKGLKKPRFLFPSALFAGLNLAVYQSERIFTPLLILALVIIYREELFAVSKKYLIGGIIIGLLAVLPTVSFVITNPTSLSRAEGTSITSQVTQQITTAINRVKDDKDNHDLIGQVIDNRRLVYAKEIFAGYFVHFDPNWLFLEGDNPRHHAPGMGLLYLFDLPFLLLGIYYLLFSIFDRKTKYFVFSWLLLAPIPAAITYEVPHAVRTMNMLPMLLIFTAMGYVGAFMFMKKIPIEPKYKIGKNFVYTAVICLAIFNFIYYLNQYFIQQNYFNAIDWQYGYQQAIPQIEQLKGNYQKVVVTDRMPMDKSYMFFMFYLHYPPQQYQQLIAQGQNLLTNNHHFDNYEFRNFDWNTEKVKQNILYVGTVNDFPKNIKAKETVYYPDGTPAILLVDPKDNL
jgi:4-amino-4-deoxy-L-arabinose transferase-like glycosyltransferase